MSKKVKGYITAEMTKRFGEYDGVAVISPKGLDGKKNHGLRGRLREKKLRMTVVKNTLARRAVEGKKLQGFDKLLDGPSALIYGDASIAAIARLLLDEKKADDKLELRGAFFDGEIYLGDDGITTASKLPTREEAIANIAGAILGPGKKLAASIKGPGGVLGGILKAIEAKAPKGEEKGDDAAPAGETPAA